MRPWDDAREKQENLKPVLTTTGVAVFHRINRALRIHLTIQCTVFFFSFVVRPPEV